MKRLGYLAILVVVGAMAVTLPASAESTQVFKAQFHDSPSSACPPGADICGKGVVKGFGTATTSLTFTSFVPGPGANCVTATATRTATLDSDGSVLQLALVGTICDQKVSGIFVIAGGTGVFNQASGGGMISGVAIRGVPSDAVHFEGTITLPS
jgi:hypothetical protein